MRRKSAFPITLLFASTGLTGFSSPLSQVAEREGVPWWIWLLIIVVLAAFFAFMVWWWMRRGDEDEVETRAPPPAPPEPDDLKRIEGIGPKISGVLQAAGIATFAQLADADVDQIKRILEEESPNLLRLADPTTWPEQARLAADGAWDALEKLQGELTGGRRA